MEAKKDFYQLICLIAKTKYSVYVSVYLVQEKPD